MPVTGAKEHAARLRRITSPASRQRLASAVFKMGQSVQAEANRLITANSSSGAKGGKHQHVASLPGEPPNNFTSTLRRNIETTQVPGELTADVTSNAPYGAALEKGTSKMEPRPYMVPALENKREAITAYLRGVVSNIVRDQGDSGGK